MGGGRPGLFFLHRSLPSSIPPQLTYYSYYIENRSHSGLSRPIDALKGARQHDPHQQAACPEHE